MKLNHMPSTPMAQKEMEQQCLFVSSCAELCESITEEIELTMENYFLDKNEKEEVK